MHIIVRGLTPAKLLEKYLSANGLTKSDFCLILRFDGFPQGKTLFDTKIHAISMDLSEEIGKFLGTSSDYWYKVYRKYS